MTQQAGITDLDMLPSGGRVHIIGAGPVGLLLTALLQARDGISVRLYEKRSEYTRTRMVETAFFRGSVDTLEVTVVDRRQ